MKYLPFDPTSKQRSNLERLAAHLELGVTNKQFNMEYFNSGISFPAEASLTDRFSLYTKTSQACHHDCGTIACAAGHGPSLGIEPLALESWMEYTERCFTGRSVHGFQWMFSAQWAEVDNTPRGAAARIRIALKNRIPADYYDPMSGRFILCYTVQDYPEDPRVVRNEQGRELVHLMNEESA